MRRLTARELLFLLVALAIAPAIVIASRWKAKADLKGQEQVEPFRIAGNFYYVGANDVSAFLITAPEGHVLLDGGYPTTAPMIMASIATLGFEIKDVKVLLNSTPFVDHAGGLAAIQQASGAALWASDWSAAVIASGGKDPNFAWPFRVLGGIGVLVYPPARVDHRITDGDVIRVGPIALTAHITPGSSPGCTSWSFTVRDGTRALNVVSACPFGMSYGTRYAGQAADIERSLRLLRTFPVDIWVTSRARAWGRYRKFAMSREMKRPVEAFVDPDGYRKYLDTAEAELRSGLVH